MKANRRILQIMLFTGTILAIVMLAKAQQSTGERARRRLHTLTTKL